MIRCEKLWIIVSETKDKRCSRNIPIWTRNFFEQNKILYWSIKSLIRKNWKFSITKEEIVSYVWRLSDVQFISFLSLSVIHFNDYFSLKIIVGTNVFVSILHHSFSPVRYWSFSIFRITIRTSQGSTREIEVGTNRFNHTGETICRIMKCSSWPFLAG